MPKASIRDLLLLAAGCAVLFCTGLGARDHWNPNEPSYAQVVVEMTESGDYLVPTLNSAVFAEKPIFYYWSGTASAALLGGISEFTLRVPMVLSGTASTLLVYLLLLPYVGRQRALFGAVIFVTQYLVWWTSKTVQMDIFVLLSSLATVVVATRRLDFDLAPRTTWLLVGITAGFGFTAKGPVTILVPGVIVVGWLLVRREWPWRLLKGWYWFLPTFALFGLPWYALLYAGGHFEVLHEVLLRQNFSRFVEAWDHNRPWWYYLQYFWTNYAPWSWLVPVAAFVRPAEPAEKRLHGLAWAWILGVILFFSLSDSKRTAYILPIAPAVAVLAESVVYRFNKRTLSKALTRAATGIFGFYAGLSVALGVTVFVLRDHEKIPADLSPLLVVVLFLVCGGMIGISLLRGQRPFGTPTAMAAAMILFCMVASIHILPALNVFKSHRPFAEALAELPEADHEVVSFLGARRWVRGGYPYYMGRQVPHIDEEEELHRRWNGPNPPCVLMEDPQFGEQIDSLVGGRLVLEREIGSQTGRLVCPGNTP
jgi:4-amino-4-deoxy-L-arabinose transferase-like glycosyltransferase